MGRPASDISERIVHAARERFLLQGVDGASLRQIAKEAGTNIGMVYYYFKTKDDLFLAVVEEAYSGILADVTRALADDVPPEQRVSRLYQRIAQINDVEFTVVRLILREALISSTRFERLAKRFEAGHFPLIMKLVGEGLAQQRFRADVHPLALVSAMFTLGMMPQIMHRLVSASSLPIAGVLPSRQDAAAALCDVLLRGIGGPALG